VSLCRRSDNLKISALSSLTDPIAIEFESGRNSHSGPVDPEIAHIISMSDSSIRYDGHIVSSGAESRSIVECTRSQESFSIDSGDDFRAGRAFPNDKDIRDEEGHAHHHSSHDKVSTNSGITFHDSVMQWSDADYLAIVNCGPHQDTDLEVEWMADHEVDHEVQSVPSDFLTQSTEQELQRDESHDRIPRPRIYAI
jgi:hypothetical protein